MKAALRFSLFIFAGLTLLQAAWIITVPPFRGIDEFDHVFRAVGVADGQWRLSVDTPQGRGLLVAVPNDVADAASAQCDALEYTGRDNCFPVEELPGGRVTISTAAATYHPAYYFVIGSVGQFFEGAGVDYAMRVASSLISALGVACAALCLALAGAGRWMRFGLLVALTPVLVYTSTMPAPNSIEIVAGLCLWAAANGLLRNGEDRQYYRIFLVVATTAACILVTVRTLGPMWLALIMLTVAFWFGWGSLRKAIVAHRWSLLAASALVAMSFATSAWWTLSANQLAPSEDMRGLDGDIQVDLGLQPVVWLLQIIAAFPLRGEVAPPAVYAAVLVVLVALLLTALRAARWRQRVVLGTALVVIAVFPIALTVATVESQGVIWQGRYGLPFAVGIPLLLGSVLDEADFAPREGSRLVLIGATVLAIAHCMGIEHVLSVERSRPVSLADPTWLVPHASLTVSLTLLGWVVLLRALHMASPCLSRAEGQNLPRDSRLSEVRSDA